jgi:prepilin signal peptidase PulO-like enzyme (type II secretory pathway)
MPAAYAPFLGLLSGLLLDAIVRRLTFRSGDGARDRAAPAPPHWAQRAALVALTTALFVAAAARYDDPGQAALAAGVIAVCLACAASDLRSFRVPNAITYPAIVAMLILAGTAQTGLWQALAGGAVAGGILLAAALLTGGNGMGMGDVKLAAFAGLAVGLANVGVALATMALAGGLVALLLLALGTRRRRDPIPYAPFISAGTIVALLWRGSALTL